jgi:hypothetical protein
MLLTDVSKSTSACKIAFSVSLIILMINSAFLRRNQGDLSQVTYPPRQTFSLELGLESKMISRHAEITRTKRKPGATVFVENVAHGAAESAFDKVGSDAVAQGD